MPIMSVHSAGSGCLAFGTAGPSRFCLRLKITSVLR
jgi:hypothetical protein